MNNMSMKKEKEYRSVIEIEKKFFPKLYKKRTNIRKSEELSNTESGLMIAVLGDIKKELMK